MVSSIHKGWLHDAQNGRLAAVYNGTEVFDFDADDMAVATDLAVAGSLTAGSVLAGNVGYASGYGGAATQVTNSSTGVLLDNLCGQITTVALTTAAGAEERFTVSSAYISATDVVVLGTTYDGAGTPMLSVQKIAEGAFDIVITNVHASAALNAAMVINLAVIKAVAS